MVNKNNQTKDSIAFEKEYAEFVIRVGLKIGYYRGQEIDTRRTRRGL